MTIRIKYSSCVNFKPQENHQESQRHINGQPLHEEDSMLRVFFSLYKFYFLGNLTGGSMFTTRPVKINSKETCIPITSSLVDDHDQEFKEILTVMGVPGRKAIEDPKKDGIEWFSTVHRQRETVLFVWKRLKEAVKQLGCRARMFIIQIAFLSGNECTNKLNLQSMQENMAPGP
ncbi:hypothetical protein POTOM_018736 [Populus tomentosa]|uniref:Uncharacterized protein n=1 Tax=Populus tomentosa TaxID=118781 RepID=A0A8X7ZW32_POPTO|nr:hypothetical protein POTOM_018736 [Populus tomentosa]